MSKGQWRKLDVVERLERGELTIAEGAQVLGLCRRQMQRIRKQVKSKGARGVLHGNAGREPTHKTGARLREQIVVLRQGKYEGFNDQHFTEKLREVEGLSLSRETVRRILRDEGIEAARKRRAPKHRRRRDRRAQSGQMILWDGSRHDWLETRGPRLCLMGAIDDATGELLPGAHFTEQESTVGYLRVLHEVVTQKGVPLSVYMDRHAALKRNDDNWTLEEQLAGRQEPTHVKRALDDLGIQVIYALSAQAKGRVERLWGTLQDRLVSELRLAKACTAAEADAVLETYRFAHNKRFAVSAKESHSAWRSYTAKLPPHDICALQYVRMVNNNNTVKIGKVIIDIPKQPRRGTFAKATVMVCHLLSGRYHVYLKDELIGIGQGQVPIKSDSKTRSLDVWKKQRKKYMSRKALETETNDWEVTESLTS